MATDEQRKARLKQIAADNSAWVDERFSGLDQRGMPIDFTKAGSDSSDPWLEGANLCPEFDPANPILQASKAAREARKQHKHPTLEFTKTLIDNLDAEGRKELAATSPEMLDDVEAEQVRDILNLWTHSTSDYHPCGSNHDEIRKLLALSADLPPKSTYLDLYREGVLTAENLDLVWEQVKANGDATFKRGQLHQLSQRQLQEISFLCSDPRIENNLKEAVIRFTFYVLGLQKNDWEGLLEIAGDSEDFDRNDAASIMASPALRPVMELAAGHVFSLIEPTFPGWTPELAQWFRGYVGNRFPTVELLLRGWKHLQTLQAKQESYDVLHDNYEASQPTPERLDDLDDQSIETLLNATKREYSRQRR